MNFHFGRINLLPETRLHREPVFDVAMIGHTDKQADLSRLFANQAMLKDMRDAGYSSQLDKLFSRFNDKEENDQEKNDNEKNDNEKKVKQDYLYNLPIPLHSFEEFQQLFSVEETAEEKETKRNVRYQSRLGHDYSWLALAVADFFSADVMRHPRRLWIIPVDEQLEVQAFLPGDNSLAPDVNQDNAFLRALALPQVGIICMPDFERLHIAQAIKPVPKLRVVNPVPAFLPCGTNFDDGVIEWARQIKPKTDNVDNFVKHLRDLLTSIGRFRRDLSLLMSFPYDKEMEGELPVPSDVATRALKQWMEEGDQHLLRHAQLVYPFLQNSQGEISSACGLLAGQMLVSSTEKGSWRSIAGVDLHSIKKPFPNLSIKQTALLRDGLGIGVLHQQNAKLQLDDERLLVAYVETVNSTNSGELARFMGWLIRSLENLGLSLVFDSRDAVLKSKILLRDFFGRLYTLGALRGKKIEDAFTIETYMDGEACIIDIEIAPALAIDKLIIDLRVGSNGVKALEVRGG
jgi:hypothetical protein